jgi:hypothetical protein
VKESLNGKLVREYDRPAVDPNTRARLFLEGMKMIVSKMQSMPKDSDESVTNANKLMADLKSLERQFDRTGDTKSDKDGMVSRPSEIQTKPPTTGSTGLA